uniref:Late embryogenesis abundant protein LEA-2 subgroup domain-containing protein n=1 Tax=Oryza barthii TaxID=65489 RepID=A0A0D3GC56_9ORYZ
MSPAAASASSTSKPWSPKEYLLLALAGTLVAAVIVVAVSAVLSPAAIRFFVANATHAYVPDHPAGMYLNFTILAVNPGWRAGVCYTSFDVDLVYTSSNRSEWGTTLAVLPAKYSNRTREGKTRLPIEQRPHNYTTYIVVPLFVGADDWIKYMDGGRKIIPMSVQVRTTVRFFVWRVNTRSYAIAVLCHLNLTLFTNITYHYNYTAPCVDAGLIHPHLAS